MATVKSPDDDQTPSRADTVPSLSGHDPDQVLMTRVGLQIPPDAPFNEWERAGHLISGLTDAATWCLGDWLIFGKEKFPDRYVQAIRAAGLKYQTLRNYAWVARRFDIQRRRGALTFQHHAEVASLPNDDQDWWLDRAESKSWPSKSLRRELQLSRAGSTGEVSDTAGQTPKRIDVPENRVLYWRRAADEVGVGFQEWIIAALDRAAGHALETEADDESYEMTGIAT